MKTSIKNIEIKYLYLLFFLLGFNKFILYLPITILYLLFFHRKWSLDKSATILIILNLITISSLFLIGHDRMLLADPYKLFIVFPFIIVISGLSIQNQNKPTQIKMLIAYIIGFGFESLIIAGYSFFFNDGNYGYGNLYDPFIQKEINSPIISNNLAIFVSVFVFYLFNKTPFKLKILNIFFLLTTVTLGIFLGGRTFFIILFFASAYSLIKTFSLNKIIYIIILALLFIVTSNYFSETINIDLLLKRFEHGLESKRFLHYQHGLQELIIHPFGGYNVDQSIEKTKWFHNIFFDMGRIAGWIPLISFTIALLYALLKSTKKIIHNNANYNFALLIFIVTFIILQQDISIEGDYRSFIILFLSSIILCTPEKNSIKQTIV